ncbi:MAG TPA: PQQ-binding-like beta-propeller repeat protein [Candidatus Krumholzibacteria bacterium]|nr:PQQ-binding-like beta-propeller repeat protein [Candidatus Krumholzibacteria bacterium]HPD70550.1 PQQ-binding-like beta-propeller repeat protein [Candidatus Krumholzibacteria bacterium]HRY39750.1 PQQ-binding-like beta-propeller repeat protein [Candidatus Krumholzibacteria bacterium]
MLARGSILLVAALGSLISSARTSTHCIDYRDYLHRDGFVNTGAACKIALAGPYAYLSDGYAFSVIDVADPEHPSRLTSLDLPSFGAGLTVAGSRVYLTIGTGLTTIDVQDPRAPRILETLRLTGGPCAVGIAGNHAFVAAGEAGLQVIDIADLSGTRVVASLETPGPATGVAISGSHVFVSAGDGGLVAVDVSDPRCPAIIATHPLTWASDVAVSGTHAYVANLDLTVFDIADPFDLQLVGLVSLPGIVYNVAASGTHVFVYGERGFHAIDARDPRDPQIVGSLFVHRRDSSGGLAVAGGHAYAGDCWYGMYVIDIANPAGPPLAGRYPIPGSASRVGVAASHAYVAAAGRLRVVDLSDWSSQAPRVVGSLQMPGTPLDLAVAGRLVYVADGAAGLSVVDVADPRHPQLVASAPLPDSAFTLALDGGSVYVLTGYPTASQLCVVDVTDPGMPEVRGQCSFSGQGVRLAASGGWAYATIIDPHTGYGGLRSFDVTDPWHPHARGGTSLGGGRIPRGVVADGPYAYVATQGGLHVVSLQDPASPETIASVMGRSAEDVAVAGGFAYLAATDGGMEAVDIADPSHPRLVSDAMAPGLTRGIATNGDLVCLASSNAGLQIFPAQCAPGAGARDADRERDAAEAPRSQLGVSVHPNPSNPRTTVSFALDRAERVVATVHDLAGRRLATLVDDRLPAGAHDLTWSGMDAKGRAVGSGDYIVRLAIGTTVTSRKLTLIH